MKIYFGLSSLLLASSSVSAFAPSSRARATFVNGHAARAQAATPLKMQDTANAVAAAKEASEQYGGTSPEARMAWELVEELDAANRYVSI